MRYVDFYPFKQPPGAAGELTSRFSRSAQFSDWATGREDPGFETWQRWGIFLFSKTTRLAVRPTLWSDVDRSPPSSAEVKNE